MTWIARVVYTLHAIDLTKLIVLLLTLILLVVCIGLLMIFRKFYPEKYRELFYRGKPKGSPLRLLRKRREGDKA